MNQKLIINGVMSEGEYVNKQRREKYEQRVEQVVLIFKAIAREGIELYSYNGGQILEPYKNREDLTQTINYTEIREWAGIPETGLEDEDERIDDVIELVCKAFARGIYGRK